MLQRSTGIWIFPSTVVISLTLLACLLDIQRDHRHLDSDLREPHAHIPAVQPTIIPIEEALHDGIL